MVLPNTASIRFIATFFIVTFIIQSILVKFLLIFKFNFNIKCFFPFFVFIGNLEYKTGFLNIFKRILRDLIFFIIKYS